MTLFEQDDGMERPFLVTNRFNLLEVLTSRLVEPVEAFAKYYRDLLELCPGRLPFIGLPFPIDVVDFVLSEERTAFPVAIEVEPQVLGAGTPQAQVLSSDGRSIHAWAAAGTIPLTHIIGIHFRSAVELDEHRMREYSNLRHPESLYRVSPDLYEGPGGHSAGLFDWLRSTESAVSLSSSGGLPLDRVGGAIALMATTCPSVEPAVETLRRCVDPSTVRKGKRPFAEWLVSAITARPTRKPEADEILFSASFAVFGSLDRSESWRAADVLSTVQGAVESRLDRPTRDRLLEHFDRMRQILRSERPFERLRPHGSPAEKALLLALVRPDPERLAAWSPEETGADWAVTLAASALVGALRGRRRMPIELRPGEVDDFLARREAASWNTVVQSTLALRQLDPIRLESTATIEGRRLRIIAGRSTLGSWLIRDEAGAESTRLDRWDEAGDLVTEEALIAICDELGWDDCTMTYVDTSGRPLEQTEPWGTTYSVSGQVTVRRGLNVNGLRSRLESKDTSPLDRERVLALLEAAPQRPPDAQRYSN